MQTQKPEGSLFDLLGHTIKDLERIVDDPNTLTFVARRVGNIVKHMKDLCEDLQPRGGHGTNSRTPETNFRPPQRIETMR
jgi:hypothetical protein